MILILILGRSSPENKQFITRLLCVEFHFVLLPYVWMSACMSSSVCCLKFYLTLSTLVNSALSELITIYNIHHTIYNPTLKFSILPFLLKLQVCNHFFSLRKFYIEMLPLLPLYLFFLVRTRWNLGQGPFKMVHFFPSASSCLPVNNVTTSQKKNV